MRTGWTANISSVQCPLKPTSPNPAVTCTNNPRRPIEEISSVCDAVQRVEKDLDGRGRVLIRYSGTEPKARVMVEGEDESRVDEYANEIAESLRRAIGGG